MSDKLQREIEMCRQMPTQELMAYIDAMSFTDLEKLAHGLHVSLTAPNGEKRPFDSLSAYVYHELMKPQPKCLDMIWANEAGQSVWIYEGAHGSRIIEIRGVVEMRETVLARASIEMHNRKRAVRAFE